MFFYLQEWSSKIESTIEIIIDNRKQKKIKRNSSGSHTSSKEKDKSSKSFTNFINENTNNINHNLKKKLTKLHHKLKKTSNTSIQIKPIWKNIINKNNRKELSLNSSKNVEYVFNDNLYFSLEKEIIKIMEELKIERYLDDEVIFDNSKIPDISSKTIYKKILDHIHENMKTYSRNIFNLAIFTFLRTLEYPIKKLYPESPLEHFDIFLIIEKYTSSQKNGLKKLPLTMIANLIIQDYNFSNFILQLWIKLPSAIREKFWRNMFEHPSSDNDNSLILVGFTIWNAMKQLNPSDEILRDINLFEISKNIRINAVNDSQSLSIISKYLKDKTSKGEFTFNKKVLLLEINNQFANLSRVKFNQF